MCSILIVDDDQVTRDALVHLLTRVGHAPVAAGTVAEGMAMLDGQACAILDLNLPDGVGTEILARIRLERRPIRVVVATATVDDQLFADAESLRPDLLLRKPFHVNALLAWLDASAS